MIKIKDIKYAVYGVSDLDAQEAFMRDFGLVTTARNAERLYMRGSGPSPYIYIAERSDRLGLLAIGMEAGSAADFEAAAALQGAGPVEKLSHPGGGWRIRCDVPGGLPLEVVHGIEDVPELPRRQALSLNHGTAKPRTNATQRPPLAPAPIIRLGHAAVGVSDIAAVREWLGSQLGMLVSDTMLIPGSSDILGYFMRCDRGEQPADHHTFLIARASATEEHHISFEVEDLDGVCMGHEWLKSRCHTPHWGVGRHVLGSQIFDYWWDPDGNRLEHYTDGDVFDNTVPPGEPVEATNDKLYAWGPPVPEAFFTSGRRVSTDS